MDNDPITIISFLKFFPASFKNRGHWQMPELTFLKKNICMLILARTAQDHGKTRRIAFLCIQPVGIKFQHLIFQRSVGNCIDPMHRLRMKNDQIPRLQNIIAAITLYQRRSLFHIDQLHKIVPVGSYGKCHL